MTDEAPSARPPRVIRFYRLIWKIWKERRFKRFVDTVRPERSGTLLDIGGYPFNWFRRGEHFSRVDVLNLGPVQPGGSSRRRAARPRFVRRWPKAGFPGFLLRHRVLELRDRACGRISRAEGLRGRGETGGQKPLDTDTGLGVPRWSPISSGFSSIGCRTVGMRGSQDGSVSGA